MLTNGCAALGRLFAIAVATGFLWVGMATAEEDMPINTGYFGNVAILGYDPVAYFSEGRAVKGSPEIKQSWLGAIWYFSSDANRDAFAADPIRYAPQYGGFCAMSTAFGEISANIDPEAWRIIDGRLYLFGGKAGLEEDFDPNAAKVLADAEAHWPEVKKEIQGN
jgi:YHS domain-containing protein